MMLLINKEVSLYDVRFACRRSGSFEGLLLVALELSIF